MNAEKNPGIPPPDVDESDEGPGFLAILEEDDVADPAVPEQPGSPARPAKP